LIWSNISSTIKESTVEAICYRVCALTRVSCEAISLYLVEAFHWNWAQIFIHVSGNCRGFQGQKSKITFMNRRDAVMWTHAFRWWHWGSLLLW